LRETQQRPQALVLTAQKLDFARGLIETELEIAFGHACIRRALYVPTQSALPAPPRNEFISGRGRPRVRGDHLLTREVVKRSQPGYSSISCRFRGGWEMIQQGQVFKLKARDIEGEPLWAYR
jgi:hypothetical protein